MASANATEPLRQETTMPDRVALAELDRGQLAAAAASAHACLLLESTRACGFIIGGPAVDVERCEESLPFARERCHEPTEDDVDLAVAQLVAECSRA
jgi:hypothetical protein